VISDKGSILPAEAERNPHVVIYLKLKLGRPAYVPGGISRVANFREPRQGEVLRIYFYALG